MLTHQIIATLEIVEIYEDWLYSVQFDEEDLNEFSRVFKQWHNLDYLVKFFSDNAAHIDTPFWREAGLDPASPEFNKIDQVLAYLRANGITDSEDI